MAVCGKCGARRIDRQIGLEATPGAYLARMVEVFREVKRVLRSDGTCWANMGDGYAGGNQTGCNDNGRPEKDRGWAEYDIQRTTVEKNTGIKPKDLIGMPWRLAFALQEDGWWLRSEIIWAKPNTMPESVRDRPTKAHEQIFLLTKAARYFYDAQAIAERSIDPESPRPEGRNPRNQDMATASDPDGKFRYRAGFEKLTGKQYPTRNARSVWTIATQPFSEAHFATFPEELPRRCIKAGTSERGVCPQCGAPWTRVVERTPALVLSPGSEYGNGAGRHDGNRSMLVGAGATTLGWEPTCTHGGEPVPATVLDIFAGSGTTIMVALQLGRSGLGIELNPEYAAMARRRIVNDAPLFNSMAAAGG